MSVQCVDIHADRAIGDYWERQFCKMAANSGRSFTPHQIGRDSSVIAAYRFDGKYHTATLPDITIWTSPGEHHEIKHKDQTARKEFGLERYRVNALRWFAEETGQSVNYTIHDYDYVQLPTRKERKAYRTNEEEHWLTASILDLLSYDFRTDQNGVSWVNGARTEGIEILYWKAELFIPLSLLWGVVTRPSQAPILQKRLL